jgi:NADH-quinone oxidoreductase subunit C
MNHIEKTVATLKEKFGSSILRVAEFRGETTVAVKRGTLVEVLQFLKDSPDLHYAFLADLTARDNLPAEPRFVVVYQLRELQSNTSIRIECPLPGQETEIPTLTGVFVNANWYERELFDLFGLTFTGHPDLRRILMPDDWQGYPLRKDYPVGCEEVQFTFNFDDVDNQKHYAKR